MYEDTDVSDVIEEANKRYIVRTQGFQYLGKDRGDYVREGLGLLTFDLFGRATSLAKLDEIRKLFLENSSEYKRFYYPNSTKFWKIKSASFEVSERGGQVNLYPVRVRLETLDQFQYGTEVQVDTTIATADGSTSFNLINDGNIWIKPDIQVIAGGTIIHPAVQDIQTGEDMRRITWQGTVNPGETLHIYPDYTARIGGYWYDNLLQGTYPKLAIIDGGTETWEFNDSVTSSHIGTVSCLYRNRWW